MASTIGALAPLHRQKADVMLRSLSKIVAAASLGAALTLAAQAPASAEAPANDDFADASLIPQSGGVLNSTGIEATVEDGEPSGYCTYLGSAAENTTWWKLPSGYNNVTLTTSGAEPEGDTTLTVYSGTALSNLSEVACGEDTGTYYSEVYLSTVVGTDYYVQVSWWGGHHPYPYTLTATIEPQAPPNDLFADALPISSAGGSFDGTGVAATREQGEPFPLTCEAESPAYSFNTTWFTLPAGHHDVQLTTSGSSPMGDTVVALYTGTTVGSLTELACHDGYDPVADTGWSQLSFRTTPDTPVYVQVGHYGANEASGPRNAVPFTLSARVDAVPLCTGRLVTVNLNKGQVPTMGDDVILGTAGNDAINALGGNDLVCAFGGNDEIDGGDGDDTVIAGQGDDVVRGQNGIDNLTGGAGADMVYGGLLGDRIVGDAGDDTLEGNAGADQMFGSADYDTIYGGDGTDTISGGDGTDDIVGQAHADIINGDAGDDVLYGGLGGDRINGGTGQDLLLGEDGNDTLTGGAEVDQYFGGAGSDRINGDDLAETMDGGAGNDQMNGLGGDDHLIGFSGNDRLVGGAGLDLLEGGLDADTLLGQAGNDGLHGNEGDDRLYGGDGDDTLDGGDGTDLISGGPGTDTETQ